MTAAQILTALIREKLVSDKELEEVVIVAIDAFESTSSLFAVEKAVKRACNYERAKP